MQYTLWQANIFVLGCLLEKMVSLFTSQNVCRSRYKRVLSQNDSIHVKYRQERERERVLLMMLELVLKHIRKALWIPDRADQMK